MNAFKDNKTQSGFTLVEMAVVLVIVAVLIAGVLQSLVLIKNARTFSTITQMKNIDTATQIFWDQYAAFPGDMSDPGTRLPHCTTAPCNEGGDGIPPNADGTPAATFLNNDLHSSVLPSSEGGHFFIHLAAAGLLDGLKSDPAIADQWNGIYPAAKTGGGFVAGNSSGDNTSLTDVVGPLDAFSGYTIAITRTPLGPLETAITPQQAYQMDMKLDDGAPSTGKLRGFGIVGPDGCSEAGDTYNENLDEETCGMYFNLKLQPMVWAGGKYWPFASGKMASSGKLSSPL